MIDQIKVFLIEKLNPDFIVLFGSQATGNSHQGSDVDVAFYKEAHNYSALEIFFIAQELANVLKTDVDLIDLASASTVFKMQIFAKGKKIYARNDYLYSCYEMTVMRMYVDLNEKRVDILNEINTRGNIYGSRPGCRKE